MLEYDLGHMADINCFEFKKKTKKVISHMYMLYDVYFNCLVSLLTSLTFIQNRQGVIDLKCVCIKLKNLSWLFLRNLEKVI